MSVESTLCWSSDLIRAPCRRIQKIIQVRTPIAVSVTRPSKSCSAVPSNSAPTAKITAPVAADSRTAIPVPHRTSRERSALAEVEAVGGWSVVRSR